MLEIKNLSKIYPNGVRALDDVTLSIPSGLFGLLGPNGAGKSTLMRTIATLQEADTGSIHLGELDVLKEKDAVRRTLGYLPQEFGLYPKVSAIDLLHHFAILKGVTVRRERKALVDALLVQTNLWEAKNKNVGGYSGGMRQRFGIAVALIGDPKLIIVDEPTAGLDPEERVRFLNLLAEIGQESVVILSTHIVDDVAELCSRMAIIDKGRILLEGEPAQAVRALDGEIWSRAIDKADLNDWLKRPELLTRKLILGDTVVRCHGASTPGEGFEQTAPQLEDVYFVTLKGQERPATPALSGQGAGKSRWLSLVAFELRYYLKRISTWVYFGVMFGLAFLMTNMLGGAIPGANAAVGGTDGKVFVNSPYVLALLTANVSLFGILVTSALAGHAGYRDFGARMHALAFTTPVGKWTWLSARFAGTILVNLVVLSGIGFGLWAGSLSPWIDSEYFMANTLSGYLAPYLSLVLPNLLFTAAIFFSLAALTRARLPHYAGGVVLLMGYMLASTLAGDVENKTLASMANPFGFQALGQHTEYWTTVEKNSLAIPLEGLILGNRVLWLGVTLLIALIAARLFGFRQDAFPGRSGKASLTPDESPVRPIAPEGLLLPSVTQTSGFFTSLAQYRATLKRAFKDVVLSPYFGAILLAATFFLVMGASQVGKIFGTTTYPVTYQVLEVLGGLFALFVLIVITFYAGELVWHERDLKVNQIVDAAPTANWVPYLAKGTALAAVVAGLLAVLGFSGILTQLARGYTNIEPMVYLKTLYGFQFVDYLLLCVLAMAIHSIVNHKYIGHLVMVLFYGFNIFRGQMGLDHVMYGYGSDLGDTYSDMNRFGWYTGPFLLFKLYWGGVALLLAVLSNLFWVRGQETAAAWRLSLARLRFRSPIAAASLVGGALALGFGGLIFWNTNIRNEYLTQHEGQERSARYEREFKQYEGLPQPRIQAVSLEVDLFPESGDGAVRGSYRLENKSGGPIDEVHLQWNANAEINELTLDLPHEVQLLDEELGYRIWRLEQPWPAGAEAKLDFDFFFSRRGFSNGGVQNQVVDNGSFVSSGAVLPSFGYNAGGELSTDKVRKKHGFEPKERMRDLDDPEGRNNTYISSDADFVDFEVVVSTDPDQIALSPGYLQREWEEDGRRYFHYEMDAPILNFFSFLSARYAVERDTWNDVAIEVYYHPGHEFNVKRMIEAVKLSLDYYTENFSPYQHRQVRILEFPRYATFAQSFPNTIPYSEAIGFVAKVDGEDIDYPTYVTAHEIAHQWWAHQVIGAEVQGATVLSETLSQYSALMVMEKLYGQAKIADFLSYELDSYLQGRSFEGKKELPLLRVENQQYIHYRKGSLVMYGLKELIGEDAVNAALRDLLEEYAFQGPPYPTSRDLLKHLRAHAGQEHQEAITDLFERITIYDNKAVAASYERQGPGAYEVTLKYEAKKLHAGELGTETEAALNDWMHVAAWTSDDEDEPLYLEKHLVTETEGEIRFTVSEAPARVGLDPLHVLVDRHPDDNVVDVERASDGES